MKKGIIELDTGNDNAEAIPEPHDLGGVCAGCIYVAHNSPDGKNIMTICRRYPPALLSVPTVHPMTGQQGVSIQSSYPAVNPEASCGEFDAGDE